MDPTQNQLGQIATQVSTNSTLYENKIKNGPLSTKNASEI